MLLGVFRRLEENHSVIIERIQVLKVALKRLKAAQTGEDISDDASLRIFTRIQRDVFKERVEEVYMWRPSIELRIVVFSHRLNELFGRVIRRDYCQCALMNYIRFMECRFPKFE